MRKGHGRSRHAPTGERAEEAPPKRGRAKGQVWTGSIAFGLVNIPVVLQSGETRSELGFTMLDRRDMSPIGYKKINKATGEDVPSSEIVKGHKLEDGRFVIVADEDLKRASPERTQRIDILSFVDAGAIPPQYF